MNQKKEESLIFWKNQEEGNLRDCVMHGCCNDCYDFDILKPHEIGAYAISILEQANFRTKRPWTGINNTLNELKPASKDLVFLDEISLQIGKFKILKFNSYGNRGHNAIKWAKITENPWLILIGVGPVTQDLDYFVNRYLSINDSNRLKIFTLLLIRNLTFYWPNRSLINQRSQEDWRLFLKFL